jgi:hypothetical protein
MARKLLIHQDMLSNVVTTLDHSCFTISRPDNDVLCTVKFQTGPVDSSGLNGVTNEQLLQVLLHRTYLLNAQIPCEENQIAITGMQTALAAFELRAAQRTQ